MKWEIYENQGYASLGLLGLTIALGVETPMWAHIFRAQFGRWNHLHIKWYLVHWKDLVEHYKNMGLHFHKKHLLMEMFCSKMQDIKCFNFVNDTLWECWEIFISLMSTLWRATNYIIRMRLIVPPSSLGHDECDVASWLIHEWKLVPIALIIISAIFATKRCLWRLVHHLSLLKDLVFPFCFSARM